MIKLHGSKQQYNPNSNKQKSTSIPKTSQVHESQYRVNSKYQQSGNNRRLQKITKAKPHESQNDDDYYDDDFEEPLNEQKRKNTQNLQNSMKKQQKIVSKQKSKQKSNNTNLKLKRQVKSVMDIKKQILLSSDAPQLGRYEAEIEKKFNNINEQLLSSEAIFKSNEQIREYIKKYNDILSDIINKNLRQFNIKKGKTVNVEESIKILQEQLKNNSKIQQLDLIQLKRLQNYKAKLDENQFNNQKQNEDQQFTNLNIKIKQVQKQITNLKFTVKNQSKKLSIVDPIAKSQSPTQITILKEKILKLKKDLQRNQQRINKLSNQEMQLTNKVQGIAEKDKQATKFKAQNKNSQQKSKKYQQIRKKFDNLKAHITKTQQLWNSKCLVSAHQNQGVKQKIKNLDLQIKNMEESVKQSYERTNKMLNETKCKSENQQKTMQKILQGMKAYNVTDDNTLDKQASLSNMKMIIGKKQSVHNLSTNNIMNASPTETNVQNKIDVKQQKQKNIMSRENDRNRVWRQEQSPTQITSQIQKESNNIRKSFDDKYAVQKRQQSQTEIKIDKPLKINLNKKRIISQSAKLMNSQPQAPMPQQKLKIQNNMALNMNIDQINEKKEEINDKQSEDIAMKSKRFNLNIKNRKKQGNMPMLNEENEKQKPQIVEQSQHQKLSAQHVEKTKPVFNLKKKRESENKKQSIQNQFILQQ